MASWPHNRGWAILIPIARFAFRSRQALAREINEGLWRQRTSGLDVCSRDFSIYCVGESWWHSRQDSRNCCLKRQVKSIWECFPPCRTERDDKEHCRFKEIEDTLIILLMKTQALSTILARCPFFSPKISIRWILTKTVLLRQRKIFWIYKILNTIFWENLARVHGFSYFAPAILAISRTFWLPFSFLCFQTANKKRLDLLKNSTFPEPFDSRAKALPAKISEKGYGNIDFLS